MVSGIAQCERALDGLVGHGRTVVNEHRFEVLMETLQVALIEVGCSHSDDFVHARDVKVLCLRVTEERQIYEKLLRESELAKSAWAPEVLENLSRFTVATRLIRHENWPLYTKMRVYDGENRKDSDPKAARDSVAKTPSHSASGAST